MHIVERENMNVSYAVIVGDITLRESDQNLEAWLVWYGGISHTLLIDDPTSKFPRQAVIEFAHSSAMKSLLPLSIVSTSDADVISTVHALSSVYSTVAEDDATEGYLSELKAIANATGNYLQEVLEEELVKIRSIGPTTEQLPKLDERQGCLAADSQTLGLCNASSFNDCGSPATSPRMGEDRDTILSPDVSPLMAVESKKTQNLSKENEINAVPTSAGINIS